MFRSCFDQADGYETPTSTPTISGEYEKVLIEVVGAMGLSSLKDCMNSYCTVDVNETIVHRTITIKDDTSPVWTVATKSLCLLDLCKTDTVTIKLWNFKRIGIGGSQVVGGLSLDCGALLIGKGERIEYNLLPENNFVNLALRFRPATEHDFAFLSSYKCPELPWIRGPKREHSVSDFDFRRASRKKAFQQTTKTRHALFTGASGEKKYRVWPFPDPDDPTTEWMTKQEIKDAALLPSKHWCEVGNGSYGSIYLEVLGCDNLPNMDLEFVNGLTDAFVAIIFEDCYVRSTVIHDSLSPRFPPWSNRAFKLNITHPSSVLRLGVFDFDEVPVNGHDPISRIELCPNQFEHNTVYTLRCPLFGGISQEDPRGSITIRLRVHWIDPLKVNEALSFVTPPRFYVNVETEKSWRVVRFVIRGSVDMQEVSVQCLKQYAQELLSHWTQFFYLLDIVAEILLWRGTVRLNMLGKEVSIWCPVHSIVLLLSVLCAFEYPEFLPSILCYLMAYVLLCKNYYLTQHPNPFCRVKSFRRFSHKFPNSPGKVYIPQGDGFDESERLRLLDEFRALRVKGFIYEALTTGLIIYKVYNKSIPVDPSTVASRENFLSSLYMNYLSYIIILIRMICKKVRLIRNFINWKTHSTYNFTLFLLLTATSWCVFPQKYVFLSVLKVLILLLLGPHAKLLDTFYIQRYYRTSQQLMEQFICGGLPTSSDGMEAEIANRPNVLDSLLTSSWIRDLGKSGRVVSEDALKLRDFRIRRYGNFAESVHNNTSSIRPTIPLPTSFAQPYGDGVGEYKDQPAEKLVWSSIAGQKLEGSMIFTSAALGPVGKVKPS